MAFLRNGQSGPTLENPLPGYITLRRSDFMRLCFGGSVGARGVRPKSLVGSWTVFLIAECAGWEDGCRLTHTQNSRGGGGRLFAACEAVRRGMT